MSGYCEVSLLFCSISKTLHHLVHYCYISLHMIMVTVTHLEVLLSLGPHSSSYDDSHDIIIKLDSNHIIISLSQIRQG